MPTYIWKFEGKRNATKPAHGMFYVHLRLYLYSKLDKYLKTPSVEIPQLYT